MKSMRSNGARGQSNRRLLRWIVGAVCSGTIAAEGAHGQQPATLPPAAVPLGLPAPLPLPTSSSTPSAGRPQGLPKSSPLLAKLPVDAVGSPGGGVQVRLGSASREDSEPARMSPHLLGRVPASTVSVAVDPIEFRPESLPPSVSGSSVPVAVETTAKGPIKFSFGDDGIVDLGVQRSFQPPTLVQRSPELVRPKKFSVSQVVTVAADADLSVEPRAVSSPSAVSSPGTVIPQVGRATAEVNPPEAEPRRSFIPAPTPPTPSLSLGVPNKPASISAGPVGVSSPVEFRSSAVSPVPAVARLPESAIAVEKTYDIEVLGTYTLDPATSVESVVARDPETCSVFHNGRMITVVGNKAGSTVVEIRGVDQAVRAIGVTVLPTGRLHAAPSTELDKVKEMISQHFPTAKLGFVQESEGGIVVRGTVRSEADARKILELIRKLCLVPIKDQIKVAN